MKNRIIILMIILLPGCEKLVEFPKAQSSATHTVIEAKLTDRLEQQRVRVSTTTGLKDTASSLPVNDARVVVFSSSGDSIIYRYQSNGWYVSDAFCAVIGKTYTLKVQVDTVTYQASGTILPVSRIDTLYYKYSYDTETNDTVCYPYFDAGVVDPENPRYYDVLVYKNGKLANNTDGTIDIFNDKYLKSIKGLMLPYKFDRNDTVTIKLFSLSKEIYDYYYTLFNNMFIINMTGVGYKGNPTQMFDQYALGYFQVSAVDSKTVIIR